MEKVHKLVRWIKGHWALIGMVILLFTALFISRQIEMAHHFTTQTALDSIKLANASTNTTRATLDSIWSHQRDSLLKELAYLEKQKPKIKEKIVYIVKDIKDEVSDLTAKKVDSLVTYYEAKVSLVEAQHEATKRLLSIAKAENEDLRKENEAIKELNKDLSKKVATLSKNQNTLSGSSTKVIAGAIAGAIIIGAVTK